MEPIIFSSPSLGDSLLNDSLDTITFSPSADSSHPLLSPPSPGDPDTSISFAGLIPEMVMKERLNLPMASTPQLPSAAKFGSHTPDAPHLNLSPSQETITPAIVRATKVKKRKSFEAQRQKLPRQASDSALGLSFTSFVKRKAPAPAAAIDTTIASEDLPGNLGLRREEDGEEFDDRNRTVLRRNMPHHPYRPEAAPYMQAYSKVLLENDWHAHELLKRLIPGDSPTFHSFGKKPPAEVLDLGCGEGFWVLHAAKLWKSHSMITGLDLIDLHNNEAGVVSPNTEPGYVIPRNVRFKRGNFVKHPLPFEDNTFDLVRMANLTLCIPMDRWKFVFSEVQRVLKTGGRLEIIDDDLFFPPLPPTPAPTTRSRWSPSIPSPLSPLSQHFVTPDNTSLEVPSDDYFIADRSSDSSPFSPINHTFGKSPHRDALPDRAPRRVSHKRTASQVAHSRSAEVAGHLETIFDNMLVDNFSISPRPHKFLISMLADVFGRDCTRQTQTLELAVPSRELLEGGGRVGGDPLLKRLSDDQEKHKHAWMTIEWDKKEKRTERKSKLEDDAGESPHLAPLTPKARQLLLGDAGALSARSTMPYQPPGLILLPSTVMPFTPLELEMHACKNMNTLLGCKYALEKYMLEQCGCDGRPLLSEREVDDYLWQYETFRRKRLNWPLDIPGMQMDEEPVEAPQPAKPTLFRFASSTMSTPHERAHARSPSGGSPATGGAIGPLTVRQLSTPVRTIRVYEALKARSSHCGCPHYRCYH